MEIQKANGFIDDIRYSDDEKLGDWYAEDVVLVLSQYELDELHRALNEWIDSNNILKVNTVAGINNNIRLFLEESRNDEGGR
jgi:hypothetical protein